MRAVLVVMTLYEGLVFLSGRGLFDGGTSIHDLVLDCIADFGSGFFSGLVAFMKSTFDFLGQAASMALALVLGPLSDLPGLPGLIATLPGIPGKSHGGEHQRTHQYCRDDLFAHTFSPASSLSYDLSVF